MTQGVTCGGLLGPGSPGRRQLKVQRGQGSNGEGVTEKEAQRPSEGPQAFSGARTVHGCGKALQLGKNICKDERIVPEPRTGPQGLFPPTSVAGRRVRKSAAPQPDHQPGAECCPGPARQTRERPERVARCQATSLDLRTKCRGVQRFTKSPAPDKGTPSVRCPGRRDWHEAGTEPRNQPCPAHRWDKGAPTVLITAARVARRW